MNLHWIGKKVEQVIDLIKKIGHLSFRLPKEWEGLDGKNRAVMLDDVVSILEEYQRKQPQANKWIPVEVEMPPQPKKNPLYENKPLQVYLVSVKNGEEPFRAFWNGKRFTDGWGLLKVEAWMPLPQPYNKEGAE